MMMIMMMVMVVVIADDVYGSNVHGIHVVGDYWFSLRYDNALKTVRYSTTLYQVCTHWLESLTTRN